MGGHHPGGAPRPTRGGKNARTTHPHQQVRLPVHPRMPRHGRGGAGPARPGAQRGDLRRDRRAPDQHVPPRGVAPGDPARPAPGTPALAAPAHHRRALRGPAAGSGPGHPPDPDQGPAAVGHHQGPAAVHPEHAPRLAHRLLVPGLARHPAHAGPGPPLRDVSGRRETAGLRGPRDPLEAHALPAHHVPRGADGVPGAAPGHAVPRQHGVHRARRPRLHARAGRDPHGAGGRLGALLPPDPAPVRRVPPADRRHAAGRPHAVGRDAGGLRGVRGAGLEAQALPLHLPRQGRRARDGPAPAAEQHNRLLVGAAAARGPLLLQGRVPPARPQPGPPWLRHHADPARPADQPAPRQPAQAADPAPALALGRGNADALPADPQV